MTVMPAGATAAAATATTYVGSRTIGVGTVDLSVTTDGALGVLGEANILDWTLRVTNGIDSADLFGPLSGDNALVGVLGTALSATATELRFNFDGSGKLIFATREDIGSAVRGYCLDAGASGCRGLPAGREQIFFGLLNPDNIKVTLDGVGVLGAATAAPEPAAWALMIAGLGLAGRQLRRRRPVRAVAS